MSEKITHNIFNWSSFENDWKCKHLVAINVDKYEDIDMLFYKIM